MISWKKHITVEQQKRKISERYWALSYRAKEHIGGYHDIITFAKGHHYFCKREDFSFCIVMVSWYHYCSK